MARKTKDKLDTSIHDVKIYSKGLITAMEKKNMNEIEEYSRKMQHLLKDILKYTSIEKSQIKDKMVFKESSKKNQDNID